MNDKARILVIEDDRSIRNLLRIALEEHGYACDAVETGDAGIALRTANNPDIVLLDLGLPDMDGAEVIQKIRADSTVPIIIVSARDQEHEKVSALDQGADDYVTKPFNTQELMARIRVALRHASGRDFREPVFKVGGLSIDFDRHLVTIDGKEVHLTKIEFKLLALLAEYAGKVLTHQFMQKKVWGYGTTDDYKSLRVFMANIRRKIESDAARPIYIITETGIGYRMRDEIT